MDIKKKCGFQVQYARSQETNLSLVNNRKSKPQAVWPTVLVIHRGIQTTCDYWKNTSNQIMLYLLATQYSVCCLSTNFSGLLPAAVSIHQSPPCLPNSALLLLPLKQNHHLKWVFSSHWLFCRTDTVVTVAVTKDFGV